MLMAGPRIERANNQAVSDQFERGVENTPPSNSDLARTHHTPRHAATPRRQLVDFVDETPSRSPVASMSSIVQWGSSPTSALQSRKDQARRRDAESRSPRRKVTVLAKSPKPAGAAHWTTSDLVCTPISQARKVKRVKSAEVYSSSNIFNRSTRTQDSTADGAQIKLFAQIRQQLSDLLPHSACNTAEANHVHENFDADPLRRCSSHNNFTHRPHIALELEADPPPEHSLGQSQASLKVNNIGDQAADDSQDLADDDGFWDLHAHEILGCVSDTQGPAPSAVEEVSAPPETNMPQTIVGLPYTRYSVIRTYRDKNANELRVEAMILPSTRLQTLVLRDVWCESILEPSDILHVVESNSSREHYFSERSFNQHPPHAQHDPLVVDGNHNLVVVHPDFLVSGSTACEVQGCLRRAVVKEQVRSRDVNSAQIFGTATHLFLQHLLQNLDEARDPRVIEEAMSACIDELAVSLYVLGVTSEQVRALLEEAHTHFCHTFLEPYVEQQTPSEWQMTQVLDIEENLWAPTLGLKGKVDATVRVQASSRHAFAQGNFHNSCRPSSFQNTYSGIVPLELKTGRARESPHRAQTSLYSLLLAENYEQRHVGECGILYNVTSGDASIVRRTHGELRDLLHLRNMFAITMKKRHILPKVLGSGSASQCSRCYSAPTCMLFHKCMENGTQSTSGISDALWQQYTGHISPLHTKFLTKWNTLIGLEDQVHGQSSVDIVQGDASCKSGCMGDLVLVSCALFSASTHFLAKFKDEKAPSISQMLTQQRQERLRVFSRGDYVAVSIVGGPYALARGYVHRCSFNEVSVLVDKPIRHARHLSPHEQAMGGSGPRYRVDVLEMQSMAAVMRGNLFSLFTSTSSRLRELIVDMEPPQFDQSRVPKDLLNEMLHSLNASQRAMVSHSFAAKDYALVVGMPGTGKTTALAHMLAAMHTHGLRVLLTSHTHSAVDTVLLKLKELKTPFVRLGSVERIHSNLSEHILDGHTPEEIPAIVGSARIFGVTCLGSGHPLLLQPASTPSVSSPSGPSSSSRSTHFDVCIIDEASQIMLPVALGPLALADRFILIGDHNQLSPVVRSAEAAADGLSTSLFQHLMKAHPRAATYLDVQYRMNDEITALVNFATYHDRLTCGTRQVAQARLRVHRSLDICLPRWLQVVLSHQSVVFVDANSSEQIVGANSSASRTESNSVTFGVVNAKQVDMVRDTVRALMEHGVCPEDIGVITPYRVQLERIREALETARNGDFGSVLSSPAKSVGSSNLNAASIECCTIDQYQGRDKQAIIVSLVRCNPNIKTGDLLRDWKRINVAFTRARVKLVLIGCATTLRGSLLWSALLDYLDENQLVVSAS